MTCRQFQSILSLILLITLLCGCTSIPEKPSENVTVPPTEASTAPSADPTTAPTEPSSVPTEPSTAPSEPLDETQRAFTVIGDITNWCDDFIMLEEPAGTWTTKEAYFMEAGTNFKIRQGRSWKLNFGDNAENAMPNRYDRSNYIVEVTGTYYIQFIYNVANNTGVINLIEVETPPTEPPTENESFLVGSWVSVFRSDDHTLYSETIVFSSDGTGAVSYLAYEHISLFPELPPQSSNPNEDGWFHIAGETNPKSFYYTLDGNRLILTFYKDVFEDFEDYVEIYTLEQPEPDYIRLDDGYCTTYIREYGRSLKDICAGLGVNYSAP